MRTVATGIMDSRNDERKSACLVKRWVQWPRFAVATAVVLAAALVQLQPAAQLALEFDRQAIQTGQWWRLLTCSLPHWSWAHLAGDAAVFAALWWLGQSRSRWMLVTALTSAVAVGIAVYVGAGDMDAYRGMSGVNYALLSYVLITLAAGAQGISKIGYLGVVAAMVVKTTYEVGTGGSLFATGLPAAIEVVGVSHAAGIVVGTLGALSAWHSARRSSKHAGVKGMAGPSKTQAVSGPGPTGGESDTGRHLCP